MAIPIRLSEVTVDNTISAQQRGINQLLDLSNAQDTLLNELADAWTGTGRPDYNQAIREVRNQTLKGLFMLQTLSNQTDRARLRFRETDQRLARATTIFNR